MDEYEDLKASARQAVIPVASELARELGLLEDEEKVGLIGAATTRAYMAGIEAALAWSRTQSKGQTEST